MNQYLSVDTPGVPAFFTEKHVDLNGLKSISHQQTHPDSYRFAADINKNVVIYEGHHIRETIEDEPQETLLLSELHHCLSKGPGIFVFRRAYPDLAVINASTALFHTIIHEEQATQRGRGDHFGNNERIWNSIQKVCLRAPALCLDYYGNPLLALACRAWLGPFYQVTAQVNNVKPGNKAQSPHRDYHLGFQSGDVIACFPAPVHVMSQYLTLQGAIAHSDMPLESGPTRFLPFSQQFPAGYMAYRQKEFVDFFEAHHVQLPLEKGDVVFFNPAVFHGAGANRSTTDRMANLVQVSSAFGKPMETVDRTAMAKAVYPVLLDRNQQGFLPARLRQDCIAAIGDGYSFPTNLDSDPPLGGSAPATMQHVLETALEESWPLSKIEVELDRYAHRRKA